MTEHIVPLFICLFVCYSKCKYSTQIFIRSRILRYGCRTRCQWLHTSIPLAAIPAAAFSEALYHNVEL